MSEGDREAFNESANASDIESRSSGSDHAGETKEAQKQEKQLSIEEEYLSRFPDLKEKPDENLACATQHIYRNWPSIYNECRFNLNSSVLVYSLADIRNAIRSGKITEPDIIEELMNFPSSSESILPVLLKHKEVFLEIDGGEFFIDLVMQERDLQRSGILDGQQEDAVIVYEMDDANGKKEVVWGIGLNQ